MSSSALRPRRLSVLVLAFGLLAASAAFAQMSVDKAPSGPFVRQQSGQWYVDTGELITWTVRIPNAFGTPLVVDFWDTPQSPECEPGGQSRPWGINGPVMGLGNESAPQSDLYFIDPDGDGNCAESILDGGGGLVMCDSGRQQLVIQNILIPARSSVTIRYVTQVDPATVSGTIVCNWGFVYDDKDNADSGDDELITPTKDPLKTVFGCTCLNVAPPNDFDFEAEKTAVPEAVPLVPNDPNATILYTITGRNTGGDDVANGTMTDTLPPGLEWVDVVTCPAPLTCTIATPRRLNTMGWRLLGGMTPPEETSVVARARVTCEAATDDDSGVVCNQGTFNVNMLSIMTDDPSVFGIDDPTCLPVVWSNLTQSRKVDAYDDTNGNGQLDPGEVVTFTVGAINRGSLLARDVTVTDDIASSPCFDPATIVPLDGGTVAGTVISWNVGDLPAGMATPRNVRFQVTLRTSEICCNQAEIQSAERVECGMDPIVTDDPATAPVDDPTCALPGPLPQLAIEKTWALEQDVDASGDLSAGDVTSYTITITNPPTAPGTATGVHLEDPMLPCNSRLLQPLPNDLPGSMVFPNEISTTDGTDWGVDNSIPYAGLVNPGSVIVDDVGGANGIVPGETVTIKFYVRATRPDICCNQATVTYNESPVGQLSDDPTTPGLVNDETCYVEPPTGPNYIFEKSVETFDTNADGFNGVGDLGRYTLTLISAGDTDLTNAVITDAPDACYTVVDGTVTIDPPGSATDMSVPGTNTIVVSANGPMAPADTIIVTFDVLWAAEGTCCNQATFSSGEFASEPSDNPTDAIIQNATCVDVQNAPPAPVQLEVTKTSSAAAGCADPGSTVTFTLTVTNTGSGPATTWNLADVLPAGLTNVVPAAPLTYTSATRTVSVSEAAAGPVAAAETKVFTYTADAPCTATGTVTNTATVTWGSPARTDVASATVTWGTPNLSTSSKTATSFDANGNGWNDPGETITWDIDVTNTGTCPAVDVLVTDVLDARFDPALTAAPTGTLAGSTITWDSTGEPGLATVAPGATVTLTFTTQVLAGTTLGQLVPNAATIDPRGNDVSGCPALPPVDVSRNGQVPFGEILPFTVDLLRNAAVTTRASALSELLASVFTGSTANGSTCGETRLDPTRDSYAVNVGATLPTGVTVTGDGSSGGSPVVYYEATEICEPIEGGPADGYICVRKAGADVVVVQTATPDFCP